MPADPATHLKTHLQTLAWSQAELARRLGVTPNTVYRWAAGLLPQPPWLAAYLDMALTIRGCVTGQAVHSATGVPLAIYALADRIGVAYPEMNKERQREHEQRLEQFARTAWLASDQ